MDATREGDRGLDDVIRARVERDTKRRFVALARAQERTESSLARYAIKRVLDELEDAA